MYKLLLLHYGSIKEPTLQKLLCQNIEGKRTSIYLKYEIWSARLYIDLVFNIFTIRCGLKPTWLITVYCVHRFQFKILGSFIMILLMALSSALKQTPCYLFLRAHPFLLRLVKHKTNDCLYSGILNEYITEFTKQFE